PQSLVVSTGWYAGSETSDPGFPQRIDRVGIRATRLRTLNGLALWTRRASDLARRLRPGFAWCGELKPAGYPARWTQARYGLPYGVILHGTELLLLDAKRRRSAFKRWTARQLLCRCAVVVANSRWTADLARSLLTTLDCAALAAGLRRGPRRRGGPRLRRAAPPAPRGGARVGRRGAVPGLRAGRRAPRGLQRRGPLCRRLEAVRSPCRGIRDRDRGSVRVRARGRGRALGRRSRRGAGGRDGSPGRS